MVLPRTMWLSKNHTYLYTEKMPNAIRDYVDTNPSHCDDIALNAAVANFTG